MYNLNLNLKTTESFIFKLYLNNKKNESIPLTKRSLKKLDMIKK